MARVSVAQQKELLRVARRPDGAALATNSYNLCAEFNPAEPKVYIDYRPAERGRISCSAYWQVIGVGFKTDPTGHWMLHGHESFIVATRQDKDVARVEAFEWAAEQGYGDEWVRDVFGGYQTPETIEKYSAWLAEQVK